MYCLSSFSTDSVNRWPETRIPFGSWVRNVNGLRLPATMINRLDSSSFFIRQDRMWNTKPMTLLLSCVQKIPFRTDETFQRHNNFFPNRIDGRVRHLGKKLLKVVVWQPGLVRKTGKSSIIAHRSDRISFFSKHRHEHELQRFSCVAKSLHSPQEFVAIVVCRRLSLREIMKVNCLIFNPCLVWTLCGNRRFQFIVCNDASLFEINKEHFSWLEPPFGLHLLRVDLYHPNFTRHDDTIVMSDVISARTQAIAIKDCTYVVTVCKRD